MIGRLVACFLLLAGLSLGQLVKYTRPLDAFLVAFVMERHSIDLEEIGVEIKSFDIRSLAFKAELGRVEESFLSEGGSAETAKALQAAVQPPAENYLYSTNLIEVQDVSSVAAVVCAYRKVEGAEGLLDFYCLQGAMGIESQVYSSISAQHSADYLYNLMKTGYNEIVSEEITSIRVTPKRHNRLFPA